LSALRSVAAAMTVHPGERRHGEIIRLDPT
jgi:hypothetical protein